jgi:hypothetical protein
MAVKMQRNIPVVVPSHAISKLSIANFGSVNTFIAPAA